MQAMSAGRPKVRPLQQPPDAYWPNVLMPGRVIPWDDRQPFHPMLVIISKIECRAKRVESAKHGYERMVSIRGPDAASMLKNSSTCLV